MMNIFSRRPLVIVGGLVILIGILALGWYLGSPLLIDNAVDEAFPFEVPSASQMAEMSPSEMDQLQAQFEGAIPAEAELEQLSPEVREAVEEKAMAAAAMMPDHRMEQAMPAGDEPLLVAQGRFQGADSFHQGSGSASIYQLPDGTHLLRFEDFSVTNGPDLHILVSSHPNPTTQSEVMQAYLDLGKIKGNLGNQNYEIPAGVDVSSFQSVIVYCQPFHVIFATASLSGP